MTLHSLIGCFLGVWCGVQQAKGEDAKILSDRKALLEGAISSLCVVCTDCTLTQIRECAQRR